jgi:hypothetical protein
MINCRKNIAKLLELFLLKGRYKSKQIEIVNELISDHNGEM